MTITSDTSLAQSEQLAAILSQSGGFPGDEIWAQERAWADQYMFANETGQSVNPGSEAALQATEKLEQQGILSGLVITDLSLESTAISITGSSDIAYTQSQLQNFSTGGDYANGAVIPVSRVSQVMAGVAAEHFSEIDKDANGSIVRDEMLTWANGPLPSASLAPASSNYTVQTGDNLWNISEQLLNVRLGYQPSNAEIIEESNRLVSLNGLDQNGRDPSLIYAGEVLVTTSAQTAAEATMPAPDNTGYGNYSPTISETSGTTPTISESYTADQLKSDFETLLSYSRALDELDRQETQRSLNPWTWDRRNGEITKDGLVLYLELALQNPNALDFPPDFVAAATRLNTYWTADAVQSALQDNKLYIGDLR